MRRGPIMDNTFLHDGELEEEKYYEEIESKLDPEVLDSLRNRYDAGWDELVKLNVEMIN